MTQVQHLVVDDVLDRITGNRRVVEDPADYDRVVGGVIVTEQIACAPLAPTHSRPGHHAAEVTKIQFFKDQIQIVRPPFGGSDLLAPASLADQVSLAADVVTVNVAAIPRRLRPLDGFAVYLGQKNVGDRA